MRAHFLTLQLFLCLSLVHGQVERSGQVATHIDALRTKGVRFAPVALLERVPRSTSTDALWSSALNKADVFRIGMSSTEALRNGVSGHIALELPSSDRELILDLERIDITASGFRVIEAGTENEVPYEMGIHYRGMVRGVPNSLAAISVFEDEVMGLIADDEGQWVLGRIENEPEGLHVLYRDSDLRASSGAVCHTEDVQEPYNPDQLRSEGSPKTNRCVRFYWEVNYDIYQGKGSVVNATNYVTGLFNQSAILYANDGIDITLQEVYVWNVPSPYTQSSTSDLLDQFGITRTSFNGDLAHLLGYVGGGGIAWLNTLCSSQTRYRMAYSDVNSSYQNVPTYSWSVEVVTHEQGHNMGSRHTHACAWNGNNTAIDGCGPAAGYSEGSCAQGPLPSSSVGGTIMSYCHLTSSTIKFANGFGPQPAALIVSRVNSGSCLPTSCGTSCDAPTGLTATGITMTSAQLSWAAVGATTYTLRWRLSPSGSWSTVSGLSTNNHSLSGLAQGTSYDVQVMSVCGASSSSWSATYTFITAVPCPDVQEPNENISAAGDIYLPTSVNALIASGSDDDHYRFTLGATSTVNISLNNLIADYDLRLLDASGAQLAISQAGGSSSESINYPNAPAGNYYIHVYGWNGASSSSTCYLLNVSASGAQGCSIPGVLMVTGLTHEGGTVSWNAVGSAVSYALQWRPATGGPWNIVTGIGTTNHLLAGLDPLSNYEVMIMSVCNSGASAWSAAVPFTTLDVNCEVQPTMVLGMKVFLDGPYVTASQLMSDDLRQAGLIPTQEPYTTMGYGPTGPLTTTVGVLQITGDNAIVDWVLVELRDPGNANVILEQRAALLQRDGDVVSVDGVSALGFCEPPGSYFVAVRHRNHLGCMSSGTLALSAATTELDLGSSTVPTYGTGARKQNGAKMTLWSGNVFGDDRVKYTGVDNDRDLILAAIGGTLPTNTINGYYVADVNLDGIVKYTGSQNDRDPILNNIGGSLPTNSLVEQMP